MHRGRQVALCDDPRCCAAWEQDPDAVFSSLQPRGALVDEPAVERPPAGAAWFLAGLWLLLGVVGGAACAYRAVSTARPAPGWFCVGFLLPVLGPVIGLAVMRSGPGGVRAGVPRGLGKVPRTLAPLPCPRCGETNHPRARECPRCGSPLEPAGSSELESWRSAGSP
jgi:hypothetical protein